MKNEFDYKTIDYRNGFYKEDNTYYCIYCDQVNKEGQIYQIDDAFFTAERAIQIHVQQDHQSALTQLLTLDKRQTGLSDHQTQLLTLFSQGMSDKDIAKRLDLSVSTIRNHRFKFREKERQANIFLAIMDLVDTSDEFVPIHKGATMVDDRYAITEAEREKVISSYFDEQGRVNQFPSKEKRKLIILQEVIKKFDRTVNYHEREVNELLKTIFFDYVTVRRYLIEYGFMNRSKDGQSYWVHV
ncbi:hypothetical protein SAMN04488134_102200 [Amphibacillus marinus]|uniref:HTH luxR-type domain-containing protein n=1 Tax=Amphibacillus marinus TaxID=872970 RepID=A0A1H8K796_9BACI|nr:DUF2087 domain-containing protein [Amphibacillus marinus]SEN88919.1 hypothetical protein SAMN04488134_102200 [Amphibacillus marinus]